MEQEHLLREHDISICREQNMYIGISQTTGILLVSIRETCAGIGTYQGKGYTYQGKHTRIRIYKKKQILVLAFIQGYMYQSQCLSTKTGTSINTYQWKLVLVLVLISGNRYWYQYLPREIYTTISTYQWKLVLVLALIKETCTGISTHQREICTSINILQQKQVLVLSLINGNNYC